MSRGHTLPWICLVAPVLLTACPQDVNFTRQRANDTFYQEPRDEVDILWIVDNSESMEEEQEELANRFSDFIVYMDEVETLMDFHLGVISTDMDSDNEERGHLLGEPAVLTRDTEDYMTLFQERITVGIEGSGMEQGLEASFQALTEPMVSDANYGFLREEAMLALVYVSDEDDCSDRGALPNENYCYLDAYRPDLIPVQEYVAAFRDLKDDTEMVMASAIVGPDEALGCDDSLPGLRYHQVVQQLGGLVGNICEEDFTGIMDNLGLSVSGVRSSFPLSYAAVENTIEVWVCTEDPCDETTGATVIPDELNGWVYDADTWFITFRGSSVPPRDSVITVTYEVGAG